MSANRRRPDGRAAAPRRVTARIRNAIIDLIVKAASKACTFSAVAQRAGVERSTLYRRFPDRWDAIIDAWMARAAKDVMPDLGDSFPDGSDVGSSTPRRNPRIAGRSCAVRNCRGASRRSRERSYSRAYFDQRMAQLAPMFDAAIARGELPPTVDREALFTFAAGADLFSHCSSPAAASTTTSSRSIVELGLLALLHRQRRSRSLSLPGAHRLTGTGNAFPRPGQDLS